MISLFLIYQQRNRKNILLCKLSADICWIFHYFTLGATAGLIPNFIGIFRELVFINRHRKWASYKIWVVFFIAMNIVLSILTFKNYYDVIPIIASSFVTISLWINNPDLRLGQLLIDLAPASFHNDIFYLEDDELEVEIDKHIEDFINKNPEYKLMPKEKVVSIMLEKNYISIYNKNAFIKGFRCF